MLLQVPPPPPPTTHPHYLLTSFFLLLISNAYIQRMVYAGVCIDKNTHTHTRPPPPIFTTISTSLLVEFTLNKQCIRADIDSVTCGLCIDKSKLPLYPLPLPPPHHLYVPTDRICLIGNTSLQTNKLYTHF